MTGRAPPRFDLPRRTRRFLARRPRCAAPALPATPHGPPGGNRPARTREAPARNLVWMTVRIEPEPLDARRAGLPSYVLCIPVLPDGRLAFRQLLAAPHRAQVWCCAATGEQRRGQLRLVDYQWTCTWDTVPGLSPLPDLRFIGASFGPDDLVGVRPRDGTLAVYRVNRRVALAPDSAGLR